MCLTFRRASGASCGCGGARDAAAYVKGPGSKDPGYMKAKSKELASTPFLLQGKPAVPFAKAPWVNSEGIHERPTYGSICTIAKLMCRAQHAAPLRIARVSDVGCGGSTRRSMRIDPIAAVRIEFTNKNERRRWCATGSRRKLLRGSRRRLWRYLFLRGRCRLPCRI